MPAIDPALLLDQLAEALKGDDLEAIAASIGTLEDAITVADAVGQEVVDCLVSDASELLAWLGSDSTPLATRAAQRLAVLGDGPPARLWNAVESGVMASSIRADRPVRRPQARLVDELMPRASLTDRFADLSERWPRSATSWLTAALSRARLVQSAPAMGAAPTPWELRGSLAATRRNYRAFVVDGDYPDGQEVTHLVASDEAAWWFVESPGQEVLLVFAGADSPLRGASLQQVLEEADSRDDAVVCWKVFSRPR